MNALNIDDMDVQRNRHFTNWHAYDKTVRQNYLDLSAGLASQTGRNRNNTAPTAG